jgi:small subunit ribosomal protein S3Ae
VRWLLTDAPAEAITKACQFVFPLNNIVVRKVKMLKKAKLDIQKLEDLYKDNIVTEKKNKNKKTKDAKEEEDQSKNLVDA